MVPGAAVDAMELQRAINAPPEVVVADRHELAEAFPLKVVLAPLIQLAADAAADIAATRDERDARGTVDGFQTADDGEQFETAVARLRFRIVGRESLVAADGLQDECPARRFALARLNCFG